MSGTRVTTMSEPLIAPRGRPQHQDAEDEDDAELLALALHEGGRVTPVSDMIEATDRSIPPAMTMIAWATAANASGSTQIARPWIWAGP